MAYCDVCGNYDDEHTDGMPEFQTGQDYQPTYIIIMMVIFV